MKLFVLFAMIFCHIVDDYYLQGILASMKQRSWWQDYISKACREDARRFYKYDYIIALIMHSLSWAFMIMLPISIYMKFSITYRWVVVFVINAFMHAIIDDLKANKYKINLWHDQLFHMFQIALTYAAFLSQLLAYGAYKI